MGHGSDEEQKLFNRNLSIEPLRNAILSSRLHQDPRLQYINFIKSACKIILTQEKKEINGFIDPINVRIYGDMPRNFLKSRKKWR